MKETEKDRGKKRLRKGFTTGTCAAAGAKAAAQALFARRVGRSSAPSSVLVTLPGGKPFRVRVKSVELKDGAAEAIIIKDAGDDPDVTHKASIVTRVELLHLNVKRTHVGIAGGKGVGMVTRAGLKVPPGRPAINPVPLRMIRGAVREAAASYGLTPSVRVTVSVPRGELLAKKTMNARLGITGGISILGTTGIVEPLSLSAYKDSISCGISVALAGGGKEVVFSTGRSTEKVVEAALKLPRAAFVLTGDHMGFALAESRQIAGAGVLKRVTVAGQFGKFSKLAAGHFETHCSDSSVDPGFLAGLAGRLGADAELSGRIRTANTAREAFFLLKDAGLKKVLREVARLVKVNSVKITGPGLEVQSILVGYEGEIVSKC